MMCQQREPLLTRKELADQLRRSLPYIRAMERRGFETAAGRARLSAAEKWLTKNKKPLSK